MKQYDYLCRKKCIFNGRIHIKDKVYVFDMDVKVPAHFEQLGIHKDKVSLEAQVSVLRKEVSTLKGRVTKLTAEKASLKKMAGGKKMTKKWKSMDLEECTIKDTTGTLVATVAELNSGTDNSAQAALVTPSAKITATAESIQTSVIRTGALIKTTMVIELKGLKSTTTDLDIIGDTGVCYIGQVTTAINGVIVAGQVGCAVVPTGGADDIDLYSATEATGAYDAAVTGLAETALVTAGGAHAIGTVKPFTALPAADKYLYLVGGEAGTASTYTAGTLIIEMWGTAS